jgi:hypothetical protein
MAKYALTTTSYCMDSFHHEKIGEKYKSFGNLNKIPISRITTKYCLDYFHRRTNW